MNEVTKLDFDDVEKWRVAGDLVASRKAFIVRVPISHKKYPALKRRIDVQLGGSSMQGLWATIKDQISIGPGWAIFAIGFSAPGYIAIANSDDKVLSVEFSPNS